MNETSKTTAGTQRLIFSDTVDQLARDLPPDDATLHELLRALRAALVIELQRRGVWRAPPTFLRVLGPSWTANDGEALDELTQDAYLYIFVQRLATLIEGRRRGHDVGPLVLKMLRQFVSHRQRLADPVGHCVYSRIHEAICRLIEQGKLHGLGEEQRIHNRTVLSFVPVQFFIPGQSFVPGKNAPPTGDESVPPIDGERLAEELSSWTEELLPELVTALGKAVIPVVEDLRQRVLALHASGVEAFRFGDLVTPLKRDVRRRWTAVWGEASGDLGFDEAEEDGGHAEWVPISSPIHPVEYESLIDCVTTSIGRHDPGDEQASLWHLWLLARGVHRDGDEPRKVSVAGASRQLEVSRRRVGKLLTALRGMVSTCLSAFATPAFEKPAHDPTEPGSRRAPTQESEIPKTSSRTPRAESAGR